MRVLQFVDEGLGNAAHLVISEGAGVAALIDPLRDVDRYLAAAQSAGVRITVVCETHIHNDFVSGGRELAARAGARIVASAEAGLQFEHQPVGDGDSVVVGEVRLTALATPGHTPEHVSYLAEDLGTRDRPPALFSGGSLLVGAVSRTDLLGHEHAAGLARQLYHSLHDKILRLADDVGVYPTHGAGSFCTANPGSARSTTIGQERRTNGLLHLPTPEAFADAVLASMPSYPTYFHHMRALNLRGPRVLGALPELSPLSAADVQARMLRGEAVVDLRPVARYLAGHIPSVYHVELRPAFASWVGWVVPFGVPVILVAEGTEGHEEAVRQFIRIGYDELTGYLEGGMAAWEAAGLPVERVAALTVEQLRQRLARGEPILVLDVRQAHEWDAGHIPQARHLEAGAIGQGDPALPRDRVIAAHCGHDARAATGLSLLERAGYRELRLIADGFEAWEAAGFPVAREAGSRREDVGV